MKHSLPAAGSRLATGLVLFCLLGPAGAAGLSDLKAVPVAPVVETVPAVGPGAPMLRVDKVFSRPSDEVVGQWLRGHYCGRREDIYFSDALGKGMAELAGEQLARELTRAGYPDAGASAFDQDTSVDYLIGLTLVDLRIEVCGTQEAATGGFWLKAEFTVFSPRDRRVVYRGTQEGHVQVPGHVRVAWQKLRREGVTALAKNLLNDRGFVAAVMRSPQAAQAGGGKPKELALLRIAQAQSAQPAAAAVVWSRLPSAVATLDAGSRTASAFLIDADGHWLTSHKAVGDAKFVKIKLANGRQLLGELLRSDAQVDVALVKTEPVDLVPLSVATQETSAGSAVFPIRVAAPVSSESQPAPGQLLSYRDLEGQRQLLADLKSPTLSLGAPLLDRQGAVVGLSRQGPGEPTSPPFVFVPIQEALRALAIGVR